MEENQSFEEILSENQNLEFHILDEKLRNILQISSLTQDILKAIGAAGPDGRYNNAGALLADTNQFSGIDCVRFGETEDIVLDRETFDHRLVLLQYDEAISFFKKYYQYDLIEGKLRKTIERIPEKAFRAVIANAIVHRAWDTNANIRVAMYEDRVEVFSPGGLQSGVTESACMKGRIPAFRNPILAGVFYRLHIMKSFGTGIRRMNEAYRDSDAKPTYQFSSNAIKVSLPVIVSARSLSGAARAVYDSLDDVRKSSTDIAGLTGFGKNKTLCILDNLEKMGYVGKSGKGRATRYIVRRE